MKYYEVAPLRAVRGVKHAYTYHADLEFAIGQIVTIPLGAKDYPGVVLEKVEKPSYDTKPVTSSADLPPLPVALIDTALWMSEYYATHLAVVLQTILPTGLLKKRRPVSGRTTPGVVRDRTHFLLNEYQLSGVEKLSKLKEGTAILHGITASGKTAVYVEYIRGILATGKSAIVLVPEIALTSQLVSQFSAHFGDIIVTHSHQTEAERHQAWLAALNATRPTVVIGPRSALFMPLADIGSIIIDEAHEPSYKQEQSPRYSALRVASVLATHHHAPVIQGSATPLISEYYLAAQHHSPIIELPTKARLDTSEPHVTLVDITKRQSFTHRFLSDELLQAMKKTLDEGHQVLIFHNRRGSASSTLCESCGWMAMCPRCVVPLTLHGDQHQLLCNICGLRDRVPTSCPACHATEIIHKGVGTKLIESEVKRLFPHHSVARYDGDTANDATLEKQYQALYDGTINIIIGTQVVAKGLDLPLLRTVGVVQADAGLALPDFSAPERTFQLLAQVVGRVGRSSHATSVIVQTYQPNAEAIRYGLTQDYQAFYDTTLITRQRALFPPFTHLLRLTCSYKTEAAAIRNAQQLAAQIKLEHTDVQVLGPTPAFYERQRDSYRWQLVVKSPRRASLTEICTNLPNAYWQFDIDPYSLL